MLRYRIYSRIGDFWRKYCAFAISILIFVIVGIVVGVIGGNSQAGYYTQDQLNQSYFVRTKLTFADVFGNNFWDIIFIFSVVVVVNINKIFFFGNHVFAVYRGYLVGYNCVILIRAFGFSGVANVIFVVFPLEILMIIYYVVLSCFAMLRCRSYWTQGLLCFRNVEYPILMKKLAWTAAVAFVSLLFIALVISIMSSKAII